MQKELQNQIIQNRIPIPKSVKFSTKENELSPIKQGPKMV